MPSGFAIHRLSAMALGVVALANCLQIVETQARDMSWAAKAFGDQYYRRPEQRRRVTRTRPAYAPSTRAYPRVMHGGGRPRIEAVAPDVIKFVNSEAPGTVLIDTQGRKLYYTLSTATAYEYPISVGRVGFTWTGTEKISRIVDWPDWHPPKEMRMRDPRLPEKMYGGIRNPMGAIALYLGDTLYRIHGTNDPRTIGRAASSGCFRMLNAHAVHLASIAEIGTIVKVRQRLPPSALQSMSEMKSAPTINREAGS